MKIFPESRMCESENEQSLNVEMKIESGKSNVGKYRGDIKAHKI